MSTAPWLTALVDQKEAALKVILNSGAVPLVGYMTIALIEDDATTGDRCDRCGITVKPGLPYHTGAVQRVYEIRGRRVQVHYVFGLCSEHKDSFKA